MIRDNKGRFAKFGWSLTILVLVGLGVTAGSLGTYEFFPQVARAEVPYAQIGKEAVEKRVEELKDDVVTRLSKECEYPGWTPKSKEPRIEPVKQSEPHGKQQAVFGPWQYVPETAIGYWKTLHEENITYLEAIALVTDWDKGHAFTKDVIFKVKGSIWRWENCANKLRLGPEIEAIRKLEK